MDKEYTVGQYLVDRLAELGLEHLFSIAGDYSIEWVNGYVEPSSIEVIEEVNELNAGYAADGYARLKGIGALCVTYSAGALCAVNAIAGAFVESADNDARKWATDYAPAIDLMLTKLKVSRATVPLVEGQSPSS